MTDSRDLYFHFDNKVGSMEASSPLPIDCCSGEEDGAALQAGQPSSSTSADTALLTGSANYMFFDADEAANQKQQKKKGKGKKE